MNKTKTSSAPIQTSHRSAQLDRLGIPSKAARLRRGIGIAGGVMAALFVAWLPLGVLGVIPFVLQIPGESYLRTHAGAAVACLMVTAWAYWES